MKELIHELGYTLLFGLKGLNKRFNLIGLFLSFVMFCLLGYFVSTILIEIWSGIQIENLPAHCGWIMLRACLIGLSALLSRCMYRWMKDKKNPFTFPKKISWGGLFFSFLTFYIVGYYISFIVVEICSGIQLEDLPARGGWMMFRTGFIGLTALAAQRYYRWFKHH